MKETPAAAQVATVAAACALAVAAWVTLPRALAAGAAPGLMLLAALPQIQCPSPLPAPRLLVPQLLVEAAMALAPGLFLPAARDLRGSTAAAQLR